MEADWAVESGGEAPVIEVDWPGYVVLDSPADLAQICEIGQLPALGPVLIALNRPPSQVRTTKCDVFHPDPADVPDADEMEADALNCIACLACYLDLIPAGGVPFPFLAPAEEWARVTAARLRSRRCSNSRADLVIRQAVTHQHSGYAVTAYVTACGPDEAGAEASLSTALAALAEALLC